MIQRAKSQIDLTILDHHGNLNGKGSQHQNAFGETDVFAVIDIPNNISSLRVGIGRPPIYCGGLTKVQVAQWIFL